MDLGAREDGWELEEEEMRGGFCLVVLYEKNKEKTKKTACVMFKRKRKFHI